MRKSWWIHEAKNLSAAPAPCVSLGCSVVRNTFGELVNLERFLTWEMFQLSVPRDFDEVIYIFYHKVVETQIQTSLQFNFDFLKFCSS